MKKNYILACESSCDETAFAIFDIDNKKIIASKLYSQSELHSRLYGGVLPELASELHFTIIDTLLDAMLKEYSIGLNEISYIAATQGPGLPGALTIGYTFAKGIAWHMNIPFIPINHLEGHIFSPGLSHDLLFPHLCFSLSGGHTHAYYVSDYKTYDLVGRTRDDACGECFDKVGKLLRLGYPAGHKIEMLALTQPLKNYHQYPISDLQDGSISFSGLKTAVLYDIKKRNIYDEETNQIKPDDCTEYQTTIASSVQYVITEMIRKWIDFFLKKYTVKGISLVGGVACNTIIREKIGTYVQSTYNTDFFIPQKNHCGDNAEMIAYIAYHKIQSGQCINNGYSQPILP
jgi:N6-L-threonylcarbamoyladenine synthase